MALGNIQCEAAPTLYLALEDTDARIKERGLAILQGRPAPENLEIATEWKTAAAGGLEDIATWCQAREGAGFVIIDILARIRDAPTGREKGVYQTEYEMIAAIKAVSLKHRVPILVTHHSNKGDASDPVMRVSGTQGLTGAADTILVLQREANDPHGTISIRGRDVPEGEIAIEFDKETGRATKLGPADDFRKSEERRQIIRAITDQAMSPKEIADYTRMKSVNVRMLLAKMLKAGQIVKFQDGTYKA
jgi:RecA-family ATPase